MNKKSCSIIVSAVILAFCMCTEDNNPSNGGGGGAGDQFIGSWKGDMLHTIVYDLEDNVLSDDPIPTIIYYNVTSDKIHFYTQIEDSCTNAAGPFTYTTSSGGDTLNYAIAGFPGTPDWDAQVTMKGDSLFHVHKQLLADSTGQTIGTMAVTATYGPYENDVPEDSWPTDACPF